MDRSIEWIGLGESVSILCLHLSLFLDYSLDFLGLIVGNDLLLVRLLSLFLLLSSILVSQMLGTLSLGKSFSIVVNAFGVFLSAITVALILIIADLVGLRSRCRFFIIYFIGNMINVSNFISANVSYFISRNILFRGSLMLTGSMLLSWLFMLGFVMMWGSLLHSLLLILVLNSVMMLGIVVMRGFLL